MITISNPLPSELCLLRVLTITSHRLRLCHHFHQFHWRLGRTTPADDGPRWKDGSHPAPLPLLPSAWTSYKRVYHQFVQTFSVRANNHVNANQSSSYRRWTADVLSLRGCRASVGSPRWRRPTSDDRMLFCAVTWRGSFDVVVTRCRCVRYSCEWRDIDCTSAGWVVATRGVQFDGRRRRERCLWTAAVCAVTLISSAFRRRGRHHEQHQLCDHSTNARLRHRIYRRRRSSLKPCLHVK